MGEPVRLQLSRARGFRLQEASRAINGLPAVVVARPSKWGNPFTLETCRSASLSGSQAELRARCVLAFRNWLKGSSDDWMGPRSDFCRAGLLAHMGELRGKNLACWCALGSPCHADVLLEMANA